MTIDPDTWLVDQILMDRPGNKDIQLPLFYSYGSNAQLYPKWQEHFRQYQPPILIVWRKNNRIFPADGAYPYTRDLKNIEFHLLDTGRFALEEDGAAIGGYVRQFLGKHVADRIHSNLGASKAAIRSLARTVAAKLIGHRICINGVSPGAVYGRLMKRGDS